MLEVLKKNAHYCINRCFGVLYFKVILVEGNSWQPEVSSYLESQSQFNRFLRMRRAYHLILPRFVIHSHVDYWPCDG
jgi:hypothetical protein